MGHVDEGGRGAVDVAERGLDLLGDVDELGPAVGVEVDLPHGGYPTAAPCRTAQPTRARRLSADADRFIAELDEEAYLHFAGVKDTYDLVPIYERHAELTALETAQALGASVDGGRSARELWQFACEGYLGDLIREDAERVAELEAKLEGDGRRRGRPVPDAPPDDRRTSPTARRASGSSSRATSSPRSS